QGPVHLNFPFREPLYPSPEIAVRFGKPRIIRQSGSTTILQATEVARLRKLLTNSQRTLLVAGQLRPDKKLQQAVQSFNKFFQAPIVTEAVSNLPGVPGSITSADLFLGLMPESSLPSIQPELLITWGEGIVSRNIKTFLRKFPASEHWHIQEAGPVPDTYMHMTRIIRCSPLDFFSLMHGITRNANQQVYNDGWKKLEKKVKTSVAFTRNSEPDWIASIFKAIPSGTNLHLANSLSVRYANMLFGGRLKTTVRVWCNRGTIGIDGCTSTAIGHQLASGEPCILLTGDVAFFYDRNAFWPAAPGGGFRVIILNNKGGQIFKMIDGPRDRTEVQSFFIGDQPLDARHLCTEYGIHYIDSRSSKNPESLLEEFFNPRANATILEIFTDPDENKKTVDSLKQTIRSIL
ncbi:MAG: hypothetical protein ACKO3B_10765, partial [Bacteroidota bacterium]